MKKIKAIGSRAERELREKLYKHGILVFRVAGSGCSRKTPGIDLIAIYNGKVYGIEVKKKSKLSTVYLKENQFWNLVEINKYIEVWLAVKTRQFGWKFLKFNNIRIFPKSLVEKGLSLNQFIEYIKSEKYNSYIK